jgi:hypothetical protein
MASGLLTGPACDYFLSVRMQVLLWLVNYQYPRLDWIVGEDGGWL